MVALPRAFAAWPSPAFAETLAREVEALDPGRLPLQAALASSSAVAAGEFTVMILGVTDDDQTIYAKAGIFYAGITAGCSCADDPTPLDEQNEYCVVRIAIDKRSAEARIALVEDD